MGNKIPGLNSKRGAVMLSHALEKVVRQSLLKIHTSFPGTVISYDDATMTATVESGFKYVIKEQMPDGTTSNVVRAYPPIKDVPVSFPVFGRFQIRPPASEIPGATVFLSVSERALDNFMATGKTGDPEEARFMEITDAVVISALATENNTPARKGGKDSFEVSYGDSFIEISKQGKFKIQSGKTELLSELSELIKSLKSLKVLDPSSGPLQLMPETILALTQREEAINKLKGG